MYKSLQFFLIENVNRTSIVFFWILKNRFTFQNFQSCYRWRKAAAQRERLWRRQLTPEKAKKLGGKGITRNLGQFSTRLTRPPSNNDYPYGCSFRFLEIPHSPPQLTSWRKFAGQLPRLSGNPYTNLIRRETRRFASSRMDLCYQCP